MVAADLVQHFEDRVEALDGKAMAVCMSRRICVALYDEIVALRPDWHCDDDEAGSDQDRHDRFGVRSAGLAAPYRRQARRELLAKRAKDPADPLKLVIVRDMWLTGFDAPCMHTMYVDKPMRGHGLMQAIARVNRVFRDKPAGLWWTTSASPRTSRTALGAIFQSRPGQDGHRRGRSRCGHAGEVRDRAGHVSRFRLRARLAGTPQGAPWR